MGVKKGPHPQQSASGIRKGADADPSIKFSFRFFDATDADLCPAEFSPGYVQTLMERLKALSGWTVKEFVSGGGKALRNHPIDWKGTSRPDGFPLPEQYQAYTPFQFSLTANEYGRVHGLLIGDTFCIVWLDHHHRLYP